VDVGRDCLGDEVPDRSTLDDPGAYVRRRDGKGGYLDELDSEGSERLSMVTARSIQIVARPCCGDERRKSAKALGVLPRDDLPDRVCAGDEEQLGLRTIDLAKRKERVDGV
jgi:hypothetical protein